MRRIFTEMDWLDVTFVTLCTMGKTLLLWERLERANVVRCTNDCGLCWVCLISHWYYYTCKHSRGRGINCWHTYCWNDHGIDMHTGKQILEKRSSSSWALKTHGNGNRVTSLWDGVLSWECGEVVMGEAVGEFLFRGVMGWKRKLQAATWWLDLVAFQEMSLERDRAGQ